CTAAQLLDPAAPKELREGESSEVDRPERGHVDAELRRRRRPPRAAVREPPGARVPGAEVVRHVEHDGAVVRVRPGGERRADVDQPHPEPVADAEPHAPWGGQEPPERMIRREQARGDARSPVDVEEVPPELGGRTAVEANGLRHLPPPGRDSPPPLHLVPVDRVPLRPTVALEDDEPLWSLVSATGQLEED